MLLPIIQEKLPAETRKHFARECSDGGWTIQSLQDAILKEIRVFGSVLLHHLTHQQHHFMRRQKGYCSTSYHRLEEKSLCILQGLLCPYRL